eukprot:TRINITY_DN15092_c0_g1_i1.p1 TRINITY_DN15092_c0_g1~~TRINITY_DN15092_c0_g1_i1.p1  ORF type:complete len:196 (-),score=72.21 TRINITY_DN15092_c0_g1_i1:248-835(-)
MPAMDPLSDSAFWFPDQQRYQDAKALLDKLMAISDTGKGLQVPRRLSEISTTDLKDFVGVFYPGGHAPIVDLAHDKDSGRIASYFARKNRPIGAICHGPAGLLTACDSDDKWPFVGYQMTCWSNWEEKLMEVYLRGRVPLYVESELKDRGACVSNRWPLMPNAIVHKNLVTGQQPWSVPEFSARFVELLDASRDA